MPDTAFLDLLEGPHQTTIHNNTPKLRHESNTKRGRTRLMMLRTSLTFFWVTVAIFSPMDLRDIVTASWKSRIYVDPLWSLRPSVKSPSRRPLIRPIKRSKQLLVDIMPLRNTRLYVRQRQGSGRHVVTKMGEGRGLHLMQRTL